MVRSLALALLAGTSLGVVGCDQLGLSSPADRIASAKKALAARDPKTAEIQLKTALQKEPKNVEARLLLADAYLAMHRGQDAEVALGQAEQFGASPSRTLLPRARAYIVERSYNRVLKEVPPVVSADPERRADLFTVRGEAQIELNLPKDAETSFDSVLQIRPKAIDGLVGKSRAVALQGRLPEALTLAESAVTLAPTNGTALLLKGDILQGMGRGDEALTHYRAAAKASPNDQSAINTLASALLGAQQLDEARVQIDAIQAKWPNDPRSQYLQAILQFDRRDYKGAAASVQKALSTAPDYAPALALAGATQYALGSYVAAEASAQHFVSLQPNSVYGRELLATILIREKQHAKAFNVIKPLLDVPGFENAQVFTLAGAALNGLGQQARGNEYLAKAALLDPADRSIRRAYGLASLASGDIDRAITEFGAVVAALPTDNDANTLLVLSYIDKKEFDQAIAMSQALVAKNPDRAEFYNLLGGALNAKGDRTAARTAFEKAVQLQPAAPPATMNLAKLEMTENRPEEAKRWLTALVARDGKDLDALTMLASIESLQGHADQARRWLATAAKENPDVVVAQGRLIEFDIGHGDPQAAVALAHTVVDRKADDVEALTLLARAQSAAGDHDGAIATYGKLIGLRPNVPAFYVLVARLEAADGHSAAAKTALTKALVIAPDFLDAQISLAELATRLGKFDEATKLVAKIDAHPGQKLTAQMLSGDIAMGQRRYDVAAKSYLDAWTTTKMPLVAVKLHAATVHAGRRKEADDRLQGWIAANPGDVDSRLYLAANAERDGNEPLAVRLYQEVLGIAPANVVALNQLALQYHASNDPRASDFAERAYAVQPGNPAVGDTLGWLLVEGGNVTRGRQILENVVAAAPTNTEARFHFAVAQLKSGDRAAARTNFAQIGSAPDGGPYQAQIQKYLKGSSK